MTDVSLISSTLSTREPSAMRMSALQHTSAWTQARYFMLPPFVRPLQGQGCWYASETAKCLHSMEDRH